MPVAERELGFNTEAMKVIGVVSSKDLNNMRDYRDNAIRYFRMTKYVRLRGHGMYIDLEPTRRVELNSLFEKDEAAPLPEFSVRGKDKSMVLERYLNYLGSAETPVLPGQSTSELQAAIRVVQAAIKKLNGEILPTNVKDMSPPQLKDYLAEMRAYLSRLSQDAQRNLLRNVSDARQWIECLRNLSPRQGIDGMPPSLSLEYLVSIALDGVLNDAETIHPNYPVDDHGKPTHTAPGGRADIECFYTEFVATCEVTMLSDSKQWMHEGIPIMRHLRDFETKTNKPAYCLFIAPLIHEDSWDMFSYSALKGVRGDPQRIVPMTIRHFCDVADFCVDRMQQNQPIKSAAIQKLFDMLIESVTSGETPDAWKRVVPDIITEWKQTA